MKLLAALFSAVLLGLGVFVSTAGADPATPTMGATPPPVVAAGRPVAIHGGSCTNPEADAAYPIANTTLAGKQEETQAPSGATVDQPVLTATATIKANLDDLAKGSDVIAVHTSPADYDTIIACGRISGTVADGQLVVAITSLHDSGMTGIAILTDSRAGTKGLGAGQVQVAVYLIDPTLQSVATPAS